MARTLSTNNTTEISNTVLREHFIVKFDFSTPIYVATRGNITFDSQAYTGAIMDVKIDLDGRGGSINIYDANFSIVDDLLSEGSAGIGVQVWMLYGDASWTASDDDEIFNGELGRWAMNDAQITLQLVEPEEVYMPNIRINQANGFNHLPIPGTRFNTPNGVVVLGEK